MLRAETSPGNAALEFAAWPDARAKRHKDFVDIFGHCVHDKTERHQNRDDNHRYGSVEEIINDGLHRVNVADAAALCRIIERRSIIHRCGVIIRCVFDCLFKQHSRHGTDGPGDGDGDTADK